jgi:hypothetical protein
VFAQAKRCLLARTTRAGAQRAAAIPVSSAEASTHRARVRYSHGSRQRAPGQRVRRRALFTHARSTASDLVCYELREGAA